MFRSKGLSLIELMIAMALGLILTLGVTRIFLTSNTTYTVVTAQSQTVENARVVKHFLGRALRHAGYWDDVTVPRHFPALDSSLDEGVVIAATNNDGTGGSDTLTVRFNGSFDGALTNCLGAVPDEGEIAVDRYFIGDAGGSTLVPALMCQSVIMTTDSSVQPVFSAAQPLIIGIENLQIELGLGTETRITQYVDPASVTDWSEVKSVRYAILATSNQDTSGQEDTNTYTLVGGETVTASGDKRLRQVQRDTVFLRNFRGKS
ncbi:MAG: hypothetical protein CL581_10475 [Alteromonadaceae bacterium]|nr:hypothetical protein [Alteromonadaceae bacterium]MBH86773.1 hypothetical protein [Alteromonadaceae bacterium]|tara:strand:+ start:55693 stop:56478 length:786 start_codon:yes stop_codon:yes gene_type:complete